MHLYLREHCKTKYNSHLDISEMDFILERLYNNDCKKAWLNNIKNSKGRTS